MADDDLWNRVGIPFDDDTLEGRITAARYWSHSLDEGTIRRYQEWRESDEFLPDACPRCETETDWWDMEWSAGFGRGYEARVECPECGFLLKHKTEPRGLKSDAEYTDSMTF